MDHLVSDNNFSMSQHAMFLIISPSNKRLESKTKKFGDGFS